MISFYEIIGKAITIGIIGFLFLLLLSLALGIILIKKERLVLPKLLLFTVDSFYLQFKKIGMMFGLSGRLVDRIGIDVRNYLNKKRFSKVSTDERILIVPQCLRHIKCPARLDSHRGITCKECGLCIIKDIKQEAERLGYKFFIVPGGTFAERIVKRVRPKAAVGVACERDLNMAMHDISRGKVTVMGVPLLKDGCVNTQVSRDEVVKTLKLGLERIEDPGASLNGSCSSSKTFS